MEKYYFERHAEVRSICLERCNALGDGTRIGSIDCHRCEFCVDREIPTTHMGRVNWIVCNRIKEATNENNH